MANTPVMIVHQNTRPSVPGSSLTPDQGSGRTRKRAEGAKNLRYRIGYQNRKLTIATLNTRTLSKTQKLQKLEEELSHIKWDILGISEHKRTDEEQLTLHSGHLLHYKGGQHINEGGVGFLIHKEHIQNVIKIHSISNRVMYLIYKLNTRYLLKMIQVYAPTSTHADAEVEVFYDDINTAIHQELTHYSMLIGDFNAKLGHKEDETETPLGTHGFGVRNERGQTLLEFLLQHNLFVMNSFYRKAPLRKWTWVSPDCSTKNEIDFIISNRKEIVRDVTVLNKFSMGSDHRLVRSKISINIKNERRKLIKQPTSSKWRPLRDEIQYQRRMESQLAPMKNVLDPNIEDLNSLITNSLKPQ
ncbi:craniofacial development protein 2-like [Dendroctonus ponderosae]|uniref:craniofacial development protein 2-like n=1 Tax=Dendroctonus ponderosae TaxID=77166 RepID=UPI0020352555|nr:craniofacial development protein 2-like [Dendroctonus ponderosae]